MIAPSTLFFRKENIMLHEKISYTDYDGNKVEEVFDFNLNKAELLKMELSTQGGVAGMINTLIKTRDSEAIMTTIEKFILMAYGEKSPDGKRFIKSPEFDKVVQLSIPIVEEECPF